MQLRTIMAAAVVLASASAGAAVADDDDRRGRRGYDRDDYRERRADVRRDRDTWRGEDGRYYCRRPNGTTGLLVGGAAGALLGREVDGGRDRTLGTVLGAAGGALLGREVERGNARCR
jgi:uncharacterized protein YcfJ